MRRSEAMRGKTCLTVAVVLLGTSACIDAPRVNGTCAWSDPLSIPLDLTKSPDREHLRQDVQVAWELSVRYGDTRYGVPSLLAAPLRRDCRQALEDTIVARHGVTAADVRAASRWRVWWIDAVAVFVPMILLTILATRMGALYFRGSLRGIPRAVLLAVPTALIMTGLAQYWAMSVETLRLRNWHLSDRVWTLPIANHPALAVGVLFAICLLAAPRVSAIRSGVLERRAFGTPR
jgi:hypothetical protein